MLLGAFVITGGVVLGTGAFSTVEADRTVTVETAGDDAALLGIDEGDGGPYNGLNVSQNNGEATITFQKLNENATITFENGLNVTNRGQKAVDFNVSTEAGSGLTFSSGGTNLSSSSVNISGGGSVQIDIQVDTHDDVDGSTTVTFYADS